MARSSDTGSGVHEQLREGHSSENGGGNGYVVDKCTLGARFDCCCQMRSLWYAREDSSLMKGDRDLLEDAAKETAVETK